MTTKATTSNKPRARKVRKRQQQSAPRQLIMRGDRILLAIDALIYWNDCRLDHYSPVEGEPKNDRGLSCNALRKVFRRKPYTKITEMPYWVWLNNKRFQQFLHTAQPKSALQSMTFDMYTILTLAGGFDALIRFLRDIESERLTLKDFQKVSR